VKFEPQFGGGVVAVGEGGTAGVAVADVSAAVLDTPHAVTRITTGTISAPRATIRTMCQDIRSAPFWRWRDVLVAVTLSLIYYAADGPLLRLNYRLAQTGVA
jgi:hypothetical protein